MGVIFTSCTGCSTIGYYRQSIDGHLSLMRQRVPIEEIIEKSTLNNANSNHLFNELLAIRAYASEQLSLPINKSYTKYVELNADAVVWNVIATPAYSMKPKTWCFPVAGCVSYRGYYKKSDAEVFAQTLANEGYDVRISGAPAYSTLGWFDDPVLSTMLDRGIINYAKTVFHELAHQQLYIKKDSAFNEAFATTVGSEGVRRWIIANGKDLVAFQLAAERAEQFRHLLATTADNLKALYATETDPERLKKGKKDYFATLLKSYQALKSQWGGYDGYDEYFSQSLNNAHLASVATYHEKVPAMTQLFKACDENFEKFYAKMKSLSKLTRKDRNGRLNASSHSCS